MRTFILVTSILFAGSVFANTFAGPTIVDVEFTDSYAPKGFDDNDNVQIVVEGSFPNSCFRPAEYEQTIDFDKKEIVVQGKAYQYTGECEEEKIIVPFNQTINLGLMKKGEYKIIEANTKNVLGEISVGEAKNDQPDDYAYAPIRQAYLDSILGATNVILSGEFTSDCVRFNKIIVDMQPKVIVVQPTVVIEKRGNCISGHYPFVKRIPVQTNGSVGKYLLHIRTMNGNAVNNLVNVR